jgi:opacity protein-like surface antigen
MRYGPGMRLLRTSCRAVSGASAAALAGALLLGAAPAAAEPDPFHPDTLPTQLLYNYGENETTRSGAMGGALRALGSGTSALFVNPAAMTMTRVYHLEVQAQFSPEAGRQIYSGNVVDSVTARLAGAGSFSAGFVDPNATHRSLMDARAGLAFPVSDRFSIGVGGRWLKLNQEPLSAPFAIDGISGGLGDPPGGRGSRFAFVNALTFDVGVTARLGDYVYLAAVGQNLTYPNNALLPTTVGGGLGFANANLSIEADGIADLTSWGKPTARFMGGGEYLVADHVPIRLGYRFDQGAKLHTVSAGLGYISPQFSIEGTVKRSLSQPGLTTMIFSVAYFLESSGLTRTQTSDIHEPL